MVIYQVMENNFRRNKNQGRQLAATVLIPIVICIFAALAGQITDTRARIGILGEQAEIVGALRQISGIVIATAEEDSRNTDLITGKYDFIVDVEDAEKIEACNIYTVRNDTQKCRELIQNSGAVSTPQPNPTQSYIAMLVTVFMVIAMLQASKLIKDRKSGTYARYRLSPNSKYAYYTGCLLHTFILTAAQVLISLLIISLLDQNFAITLVKAALLVPAISLSAATIGIVLSAISKTELQGNLCAAIYAVLSTILSGSLIPIDNMPVLEVLSLLSPARWLLTLFP